jgi:nitric oxide reductase subunit B
LKFRSSYALRMYVVGSALFRQWMRMPGDIVFATAAVMMAIDFVIKLSPIYPMLSHRFGRHITEQCDR